MQHVTCLTYECACVGCIKVADGNGEGETRCLGRWATGDEGQTYQLGPIDRRTYQWQWLALGAATSRSTCEMVMMMTLTEVKTRVGPSQCNASWALGGLPRHEYEGHTLILEVAYQLCSPYGRSGFQVWASRNLGDLGTSRRGHGHSMDGRPTWHILPLLAKLFMSKTNIILVMCNSPLQIRQ